MNISSSDIPKNIHLTKNEILNSSKKQVSKVLNTLKTNVSLQPKSASIKVLLDSLFRDLSTNQKTKDVVLQILQDKSLFLDIKDTMVDLKAILNELKTSKIPLKNTPVFENLLLDIKNLDTKTLQKQIQQSGLFLESKLSKNNTLKTLIPQIIKEQLNALKNLILSEKLNIDMAVMDKILNSKTADKNFIDNIKQLSQGLIPTKNQAVVSVVAKLEKMLQKTQLLESKITNYTPFSSKDIKSLVKKIVVNLAKLNISAPQIKKVLSEINLVATKLQNTPNIDKTQLLNLNEKLRRMVNLVKTELLIKEPKASLHVEVAKLVQTLQSEVYTRIASKQIVPNQPLQTPINLKDEIKNDIKANLLYMKDALSKSKGFSLPDTVAKIDKVLTNINYYQLLSYSANANILYLPLLWDGLDEGQISIKKLKQKRFFCEINLKLKEFGKIDLLIMLYDDIFINISIFTKSDQFLDQIKDNLQSLKQGMNNVGLVPTNIYLYDSLKDDKIKKDTKSYVDAQQIGKGVNIHV
jgi:hypothetical protein